LGNPSGKLDGTVSFYKLHILGGAKVTKEGKKKIVERTHKSKKFRGKKKGGSLELGLKKETWVVKEKEARTGEEARKGDPLKS